MSRFLLLILFMLHTAAGLQAQPVYEISNGLVRFHSDAPQELIRASSRKLQGVLDITRKTFVMRIGISSFEGFNSPLQREHFNENYMESAQYPDAAYSGKIIEEVDFSKDGVYEVRTKGKLRVHGVEQERIIRAQVSRKNNVLTIQSDFTVLLADHNIKIPRLVYDKLSPEIHVSVSATLSARN